MNNGVNGFHRIAVLTGGRSVEREVSLSSGRGVLKALIGEGFDAITIDPGEDLAGQLRAARPDAVFNALHGRFGEDGTVQGILEWLRLPYTHSGVLASALAMHKEKTKDVYRAAGLPVVRSLLAERHAVAQGHLMEPPYVVKPVNEGSSAGIFIVRAGANRPPAALAADDWALSSQMMVEEYVPGRELTVAVMGASQHGPARALAVTEITTELEFYDYQAKYAPGGSRHVIPAAVPENIARDAMAMAVTAHEALGCRGVSRTDFRYDDTGTSPRLILLETNTQPGMTSTSLVPEQAAYVGLSYAGLCRWMVEDASCDR